jgi:hypothetical protein
VGRRAKLRTLGQHVQLHALVRLATAGARGARYRAVPAASTACHLVVSVTPVDTNQAPATANIVFIIVVVVAVASSIIIVCRGAVLQQVFEAQARDASTRSPRQARRVDGRGGETPRRRRLSAAAACTQVEDAHFSEL